MDPISTTAAVGAALKLGKDAIHIVEKLVGLFKGNKPDYDAAKIALNNLLDALTDMKLKLNGAAEEMGQKDNRIREMEELIQTKNTIGEFKHGVLWCNETNVPVCQPCWEGERKRIYLNDTYRTKGGSYRQGQKIPRVGTWTCSLCGKSWDRPANWTRPS